MKMENELYSNDIKIANNFIEQIILDDIESGKYKPEEIYTRFPPEPNGYLHIGHAKAICLNHGLCQKYGGKFNLRFDDTNPEKEDVEYVNSIKEDIEWLGASWDELFFASDYFEQMYDFAVDLIEQGKAFVCDLDTATMREYRGDYNIAGRPSPYRERSVAENLELFAKMRAGEFKDGEKTLRAKIDYNHPDVIMRDPIIYRIQHLTHHNTGDKWCIYPMYDYAHPLEDAIEGITHSICTLEFESHRPLYNWFLQQLTHRFDHLPRQIEFARLDLKNAVMSKRYLKALVEEGKVDGWDDPRMPTISGIRRRGVTPKALRNFATIIGVTKANSQIDPDVLNHAIRDDLNLSAKGLNVVLNPLKVEIINYPQDQSEELSAVNNPKNPELGERTLTFSRHIYIERDDFTQNPPPKYKRLSPGVEVRLMNAYFIKCEEVIEDEAGNVIELKCSYDPATKSGSGFKDRKPNGNIHWVDANNCVNIEVHEFGDLMVDKGGEKLEFNPNSLSVYKDAVAEKNIEHAQLCDRFQFIRNGYYAMDYKYAKEGKNVYNQVVSLKSSF